MKNQEFNDKTKDTVYILAVNDKDDFVGFIARGAKSNSGMDLTYEISDAKYFSKESAYSFIRKLDWTAHFSIEIIERTETVIIKTIATLNPNTM